METKGWIAAAAVAVAALALPVGAQEGAGERAAIPRVVGPGEPIPAGPADALLVRVLEARYARAAMLAMTLQHFLDSRREEKVAAVQDSETVLIQARPDRVRFLEALVAAADRPGPNHEVTDVVELRHGRAAELAVMLGVLGKAGKDGHREDFVRARPDPSNRHVVIVGPAARVTQARDILAKLDKPAAAEGK
ncbi:MAG: hypothetical protein L0216_08420 [Planctomycetales bacterium]|nr:hypothetical protein [Planctomycetales bacterium]